MRWRSLRFIFFVRLRRRAADDTIIAWFNVSRKKKIQRVLMMNDD